MFTTISAYVNSFFSAFIKTVFEFFGWAISVDGIICVVFVSLFIPTAYSWLYPVVFVALFANNLIAAWELEGSFCVRYRF